MICTWMLILLQTLFYEIQNNRCEFSLMFSVSMISSFDNMQFVVWYDLRKLVCILNGYNFVCWSMDCQDPVCTLNIGNNSRKYTIQINTCVNKSSNLKLQKLHWYNRQTISSKRKLKQQWLYTSRVFKDSFQSAKQNIQMSREQKKS